MLSPPAVTAVFFLAQLYFAAQSGTGTPALAGASATESPSTAPVEVRVVAQIQPATDRRTTTDVPETEAELWMLLQRDGQIMFFSDEVEVLTTPAQRFGVDEVEVITVEGASRDTSED